MRARETVILIAPKAPVSWRGPANGEPETLVSDGWVGPIEAGPRARMRDFVGPMLEEETTAALSSPRYGRRLAVWPSYPFPWPVSPYLFFWQAEEEVEELKEMSGAKPLIRAPEQANTEFGRIRLDTYIGMGFSNFVALSIMITAAATLNAQGVHDIQTSSQAAEALRPIAGPFVFLVFAAGIIGTGLLALPVLAGSAAYACGESLRWHVGLARKPGRAVGFYAIIALATVAGVILNVVAIDPIKALVWSAVINGVVAVPVMALMMHLGARASIMGEFILPVPLKLVGWVATLVMAAAAVGMVATWKAGGV